jgi:hypothetical protein
MPLPIRFGGSADAILQGAYRSYGREERAIEALGSEKLDLLRRYDVPGMESAVALCFWGRSGTYLLASFLDGHDDIVLLPMIAGESIYPFFHEYESLSVWEKLVAYPAYSEVKLGHEAAFFTGDFAISPAGYYAAIHALFKVYGDKPAQWLAARPRFFQFLHAAYAVAIGQRPGNSRPLMLYAQHWTDEGLAARFVEDFPSARFIQTIRDPISAFDSWFDRELDMNTYAVRQRLAAASRYVSPAVETARHLLTWDRAHRGMEARTRAIRFEDMHLALEATMRGLADWLGIAYRPSMLASTWNRVPYVVEIRGVPCCGPNPENARRRSKNLGFADRLMVFALLHQNFVAWRYPSPKAMRRRWIRLCVIASIWLVPMKMELTTARWVLRLQALPSLRGGRLGFAGRAPMFLFNRRLRMMWLIATQARARLAGNRAVLTVL